VPRLVALDLPWDNHFVQVLQDVWEAGDAACPLDHRLPPASARELLNALHPTHVIGEDGEITPLDDGIGVEDGDALVMATSGTSALPRGVVLTNAAVLASAEATSRRLEVDPVGDKWLACIPLSHIGGLGVVMRSLLTGTPLEVHPRFDAQAVSRTASSGVTLVSLVSAALSQIDVSIFRLVLLGGAAPPSAVAPNVVTTYGMTETCGGVFYDGLPLEGVEHAISDDGEILLRGPSLLRCYRDGSEPFLPGGWFPTGDAGFDDAGRLQVSGRMSETINTGGEKVWPASVERVIATHPLVSEVAVSGRADPRWGERVVAFVVAKDATAPPSLEALRDHVSEYLPRFAAPHELVLLESLPRIPSGKVARRLLP
jgi:o-succinylbenzoate---CoA ligase